MPETPEIERRTAQQAGAPGEIRANPERLIGWYRQRLADTEHQAAVLEVAYSELSDEHQRTLAQMQELADRVADLEADDEDGDGDGDVPA